MLPAQAGGLAPGTARVPSPLLLQDVATFWGQNNASFSGAAPERCTPCPAAALPCCPAALPYLQLASGSVDLQKIAVFEGAFDRLFGIIR